MSPAFGYASSAPSNLHQHTETTTDPLEMESLNLISHFRQALMSELNLEFTGDLLALQGALFKGWMKLDKCPKLDSSEQETWLNRKAAYSNGSSRC